MNNLYVVIKILLPSSSDVWMFERDCFVFESPQEARNKAVALVKALEKDEYFHYRNYKNHDITSKRMLHVYSRSRWGMKKVIDDENKPCYDIRILPVEQCFDPSKNKWVDPRWMLYNHVEDDYRFVLDDIDAKLLVASAAMESSEYSDFKVLDMKWTEQVNMGFKCIDEYCKGLVSNDQVVLSLFPLTKEIKT